MDILEEIYSVICDRKENPCSGSYTSSLFEEGLEKILSKVEEESNEVLEAARNEPRENLIYETADLLFHLLVLLGHEGITLDEVEEELRRRRR